MSITYRLLDPTEWSKLNAIMDAKFIPHPDAASAAIAEDENGTIVGVLFLQLALHMEPLVLTAPSVNFQRLHDVLYDAVSADKGLRIYCFSDKDIIDAMARKVGMTELPYKVFEQEVK